jgi:sugar lactone lactonase YvrE
MEEALMLRKLALCTVAAALALAAERAEAQQQPLLPKTINLPQGLRPEGITRGPGVRAFVGTLNGGGVVDVNVLTGQTRILVQPQDGRMATGLTYSARANAIFVSGASTGQAFVYDADSGQELSSLILGQAPTFVNDVVVTTTAAFFTDSMKPVLYRVPLGPDGKPNGPPTTIQLGAPFRFTAGQFNANGIESVLDGRFLLVVASNTGDLYRIDPASGEVVRVNVTGGSLVNGDGIRLEGNDLLVVQNSQNQISQLELSPDLTSGSVELVLRDPDFVTPTTVASFDGFLFVVNPRFNDPGAPRPTDVFTVSRVDRPVDD